MNSPARSILQEEIIGVLDDLFQKHEDKSFDEIIKKMRQFIAQDILFKDTLKELLVLHSIVRRSQYEYRAEIEKALGLYKPNDSPLRQCTFFINIPTQDTEITTSVQNDDIEKLANIVLCTYHSENTTLDPNLLQIAALNGSVKCFRLLLINNVELAENTCAMAIAGGNFEIISLLENTIKQSDFLNRNSFQISIIYHRYEITQWLMKVYWHKPCIDDMKIALMSLNFKFIQEFQECIPFLPEMLPLAASLDHFYFFKWAFIDDINNNIVKIIQCTNDDAQQVELARAYLYFLTKNIRDPKKLLSEVYNFYSSFK